MLSRLDPTTRVTTTTTDRVAGRAAYGLVLTPRDPGTLVGSVRVSLDAATSLPLAVTVDPRGSTRPALDVRFSSLTLATPARSVFAFTPPPGATVTTPRADGSPGSAPTSGAAAPRVSGSGWTSVVVGALPDAGTGASRSGQLTALGAVLPTVSGSWGSGHLLRTRLLTVVLTDDGRVAAGAVEPSALYAALER